MAWFDRHLADADVDRTLDALDSAVRRSGLAEALARASGSHGLRRFVVRFELRGGRARMVGLDAPQLPRGGGPPAAMDAGARALEDALASLARGLPRPFSFERGAVGYVRSAEGFGEPVLLLRFDEEADTLGTHDLPTPRGEPWAPEDPAYLRALAAWDARMAPVRARWTVAPATEDWSCTDGTLRRPGLPPVRTLPLATYENGVHSWLLDSPAGDEAPLVESELACALGTTMELAAFAATRLGCVGGFTGTTAGGTVFLAGTRA